jgi:hypothetical protein
LGDEAFDDPLLGTLLGYTRLADAEPGASGDLLLLGAVVPKSSELSAVARVHAEQDAEVSAGVRPASRGYSFAGVIIVSSSVLAAISREELRFETPPARATGFKNTRAASEKITGGAGDHAVGGLLSPRALLAAVTRPILVRPPES